jgi:hypothetical protein
MVALNMAILHAVTGSNQGCTKHPANKPTWLNVSEIEASISHGEQNYSDGVGKGVPVN